MTSNERKIIKYLRDAKGKAHIRDVAQKTNFSSDYVRLLCHSLARAGYIKFEDSNFWRLLEKGHGHFENVVAVAEKSEPLIAAANVTLLTDEPAGMPFASDCDNKDEEDRGDEDGNKEGNQQANDDAELDKALADLEPTPKKDVDEEKDKPEEEETKIADAEMELKPEPEEEKESASEIGMETKVEAAEIEEEKKAEPQKINKTEAKPADNTVSPAKPSGGFGVSFKKIVNLFIKRK